MLTTEQQTHPQPGEGNEERAGPRSLSKRAKTVSAEPRDEKKMLKLEKCAKK